MALRCGIVGLPNVGKSTLFNALTMTGAAQIASYPFTTIEPNVGRVAVPDERLEAVAKLAGSARLVTAWLEFVDIAGLVRGASEGHGLGNKFLAHIREVDAIIHVLRCFESGEISHVEGSVDPLRDAELVETELMIADLESLERRFESASKKARGGDEAAQAEAPLMERALAALRAGLPVAKAAPGEEEPGFRQLHLLTAKPVLYVCNVDEAGAASGNAHSARIEAMARERGAGCVIVAAAIEAEIAQLEDEAARADFLAEFGLKESGLARVVRAAYRLLDRITFFTANPNEAHAWTVPRGSVASQAAGAVHSDFERGFISAETTSFEDYVACGGEQGAKEKGKMRQEGRDYVVQDGEVIHFRFHLARGKEQQT